jgi:uncharacterized surface protein with fasciclin (FAS1) repeats
MLVVAVVLAACTPQTVAVPPATATHLPTSTPEPVEPAKDIVDTALAAGDFGTLVQAVQAAGLEDALRGEGPFTVFAPTDAAFAALPDGTLESLLADPTGDLQQILLYHVLNGQVLAADVADGLVASTLQGADVDFAIDGNKVTINDASIVLTDIEASNGVIHVIDTVILPPSPDAAALMDIVDTAISAGDFDTLVQAVQAAGLEDALRGEGPFTVFAPTDAAFAALPDGTLEALLADPTGQLQQILLYHVINGQVLAADVADGLVASTLQGGDVSFAIDGSKVTINDASIVLTDIEAANGVIHVIDAVILPASEQAAALLDIVDTAIQAGDFDTLVQAVQAAGLEDALRGQGPYTVFAPTSVAFASLPAGTLASLLADPMGQLQQILLYHVIPGEVLAEDVTDGLVATTLQGADVNFTVDGSKVTINDANITATDIRAENGVIHVIDRVIFPPTK